LRGRTCFHFPFQRFSVSPRNFLCFCQALASTDWTVLLLLLILLPGRLRYEPSSPARTLGSWIRIPQEAWCLCAFVLCVGGDLGTGWSPVQGVLPTVYRLRNWKSGQGPQGLCSNR
jgi:hypothetical protein